MEKVAEKAVVSEVEYDSVALAKEAYDEVFGKKDKLEDDKDKKVAPLTEETNEEKVVDEEVKNEQEDVKEQKEPVSDEPKSKTDEDIVDADDKDLSEQELTRKKEILEFNKAFQEKGNARTGLMSYDD